MMNIKWLKIIVITMGFLIVFCFLFLIYLVMQKNHSASTFIKVPSTYEIKNINANEKEIILWTDDCIFIFSRKTSQLLQKIQLKRADDDYDGK